jgi:dTMP kinase
LAEHGIPALLTHEPGGTILGENICRWLKWKSDSSVSPVTELLLFNASRSHLIETIIRPALAQGKVVVCDRFTDSTLAYQGYGRGLDLEMVRTANRLAGGGLMPDLTILLRVPPEQAMTRRQGEVEDRFEKEVLAFHRRVYEGYMALSLQEPARWLVVDASLEREEVAALIWERVSRLRALPAH